MKLYLYIAKKFLLHLMIGFLIMTFLMSMIDFMEQYRRVSRAGGGITLTMRFVGVHLPVLIQQTLPFIVLLSAITSLYNLTKTSELIIARAVGKSIWQIISPILIISVLIGIFKITLLSVLISSSQEYRSYLNFKYINKTSDTLDVGEKGLWLRQRNVAGGLIILHARHYLQRHNKLTLSHPEMIYVNNGKITKWIGADSSVLLKQTWIFKNAYKLSATKRKRFYKTLKVDTSFNISRVRGAFADPETMNLWQLPDFIHNLKKSGFSSRKHEVYYYKMLTEPILYASMIFVAGAFSRKSLRQGTVFYTIVGCILFGFITYFSNNIILAMVFTTGVPITLGVLVIPVMSILICLAIIIQNEDSSV